MIIVSHWFSHLFWYKLIINSYVFCKSYSFVLKCHYFSFKLAIICNFVLYIDLSIIKQVNFLWLKLACIYLINFIPLGYFNTFKPVIQAVMEFYQPTAIVLQVTKHVPLYVYQIYGYFGLPFEIFHL